MFSAASRAPVVFSYRFDTIRQYWHAVREGNDPISLALTNNQAHNDRHYFVTIHVPGMGQPEILNTHRDFKDFLNRYSPDSSTMRFQGMTTVDTNPDNDIVMMLRYNTSLDIGNRTLAHRFMAQPPVWAQTWGLMGDAFNCVIRQIGDHMTYYTPDGEKRVGTWRGDQKLSLVPGDENYEPSARESLRKQKNTQLKKEALKKFVASRQYDPYTYGLEMRDLNDLAAALDCRIMVWINSRLGPILRWDTDQHVQVDKMYDRRYVFPFYMTSTRHLEMCNNVNQRWADITQYEPHRVTLEFKDSAFFEDVMTRNIGDIADIDKKIFTVVREATTVELPDFAKSAGKYAGLILREGDRVYKHEVFKDLDKYLGIHDDENGRLDTTYMFNHADFHYAQVKDAYKTAHIHKIKQQNTPSLFEAVRHADKIVGHLWHDVVSGQKYWEMDGHKWYNTDFSDVDCEVFKTWFHGYPMHTKWHEYNGIDKRVGYNHHKKAMETTTTYIGNLFEGDRPFTFHYGKYAIFLVTRLDFGGCLENIREHFERDKLFTELDSDHFVCVLPSPILHFLQDCGVRWQASYVWVCYGCGSDWLPDSMPKSDKKSLRKEMAEHKSYCQVMGKLMCGRDPMYTTDHYVYDDETANDLMQSGKTSTRIRFGPDGKKLPAPDLEGFQRNVNPSTILYTESHDFHGTKEMSYSTYERGGYILRATPEEDQGPWRVRTVTDLWGYGTTYGHISGAQHAYAFVRLYMAAMCAAPDEVVGFALDAVRFNIDPAARMEGRGLISQPFKSGCFKVKSKIFDSVKLDRNPAILSDMYTRKDAFMGLSEPDKNKPVWGKYQDNFKRFNIVVGPAGSGKTTRHFLKFGEDNRLDTTKVCYATLTNFLTAQMKKDLGCCMALTSFKAFNRVVGDDKRVGPADKRYDLTGKNKHMHPANFERMLMTKRCSTVFLDEVTMQDTARVKDAIEVCKAHHMQLFLVGDFDETQFFQLQAIMEGSHRGRNAVDLCLALHTMLDKTQSTFKAGEGWNWIKLTEVVRQQNDDELRDMLRWLRTTGVALHAQWSKIRASSLFDNMSLEEALEEFDASQDIFVCPCHDNIQAITQDVYDRLRGDDIMQLRGNFTAPRVIKQDDPPAIKRLAPFEEDNRAFKGAVTTCTKDELEALRTKFMPMGFPYHQSNNVNPMVGTTVHTLQGLTLKPGVTIYIHSNTVHGDDWLNDTQPKAIYVAISRAKVRTQIKLVVGQSRNFSRQRV